MNSNETDIISKKQNLFENFAELCMEWKSVVGNEAECKASGFVSRFSSDVNSLMKDGRKIQIGIVGQVKAGKSTFINSMLFNGKNILPKAATPMTAALTVIEYGEQAEAEVEYFSDKDWETIEAKAGEYARLVAEAAPKPDSSKKCKKKSSQKVHSAPSPIVDTSRVSRPVNIPDDVKAAHELVEKARNIKDFSSHLGKTVKIDGISDILDLKGKLAPYVGANGKFTPLTKSLTIKLNIEDLRNVRVIDTPGINDPIVSRGMRTRDFLGKCDAVFLLSYAGQFMGKVDAGFLTDSLPNVGIKKVVLVGSKFDSVLQDECKKYGGDLKRAISDLRRKLGEQAKNSLTAIIESSNKSEMLDSVLNCLPPVFVSSMAYNLAVTPESELDEGEKHTFNNLKKYFPDFFDINSNKDILLELSNIPAIKENNFNLIKAEKDTLLKVRIEDRLRGAEIEYDKIRKDVDADVSERLKELQANDLDTLSKESKYLKKNLDNANADIEDIFNNFIIDIKNSAPSSSSEKVERLHKEAKIQEKTESREEPYKERVKKSGAWNWLKGLVGCETYEYETRYRTVGHTYAQVYEAIESVRCFIAGIARVHETFWAEQFHENKFNDLRKTLIKVVGDNINTKDETLDVSKLRRCIIKASERIPIPRFKIDIDIYTRRIEEAFSSETVEGTQIDELKKKHRNVLYMCKKDMDEKIQEAMEQAEKNLSEKGQSFVSEIKTEIEKKITDLTEMLKHKEVEITRHKQVLDLIKKLKL